MKFKYKKYGGNFRPVIPVVLRHQDRFVSYGALVDSGADLCLFHSEVADYLGFDLSKNIPREVFGVGGKASIYHLHKITIEIGGVPYEIETGFISGVSGKVMSYGVLGQKGFFDLFKSVNFDYNKCLRLSEPKT